MTLRLAFWPGVVRTGFAAERAVRPMIIVIVLPLPQFVVEQMNVVGDAVGIQQLIKLLIVDPVRSLDLAVEMRRARADVDVADIVGGKMAVKLGLKLGAVVGLHRQDAEW